MLFKFQSQRSRITQIWKEIFFFFSSFYFWWKEVDFFVWKRDLACYEAVLAFILWKMNWLIGIEITRSVLYNGGNLPRATWIVQSIYYKSLRIWVYNKNKSQKAFENEISAPLWLGRSKETFGNFFTNINS